jgi:hypothetical protein
METQTEQTENGLFVTNYNELVKISWEILNKKGVNYEKPKHNI